MNTPPAHSGLSRLDYLMAVDEIKQLSAARFEFMDTKDWAKYGQCHAEDAINDTFHSSERRDRSGGVTRVIGRAHIVLAMRDLLDGSIAITSVHHGHSPRIRLTSSTTARGVWTTEERMWWTNGEAEEYLHGYGHYREQYRKANGVWLIRYHSRSRIRLDVSAGFFSRSMSSDTRSITPDA